jgi:hypothetical protein
MRSNPEVSLKLVFVSYRLSHVFYPLTSLSDRIAGATSEINALKEAFNRGESPITSSTDVYAVCDVIKSYFRTLPDPIVPGSMYYDFIATASTSKPQLH